MQIYFRLSRRINNSYLVHDVYTLAVQLHREHQLRRYYCNLEIGCCLLLHHAQRIK